MIITTIFKLESGRIYTEKDLKDPFTHRGKLFYEYTFFVIRESNKEEYIQFLKDNEVYNLDLMIYQPYYYQISMD